jgi:hypothetical protein
MSTVRTPIVDKNGKQTTVHKKVDTGAIKNRVGAVGAPPKTKVVEKPGLTSGRPEAANILPHHFIDPSYGDVTNYDISVPKNRAETVKALSDPSGRKSKGNVRWLELDHQNTDTSRVRDGGLSEYSKPMSERSDTFNIVPPKDGTPMVVRVQSGMVRLNIESGNAVVILSSSWGNSLRVAGDANVTVIGGFDSKLSIDAEEDATVTVVPQTGTRGHISPKGNANVEVTDYMTDHSRHSFTDFSVPLPVKPERDIPAEEARVQAWMEEQRAKRS